MMRSSLMRCANVDGGCHRQGKLSPRAERPRCVVTPSWTLARLVVYEPRAKETCLGG
ncbi:hypothetical protein BD289DRAFT_445117 [Coniella lustricola]|uniref:Uncharacterized protein n=1 Tax=Coniella lustricola TaxID=2025994 RepID=A0A2T2ZV91_9PEZI|nr:hypothetical protein BD289DRAFT_445117 [Coniella lustricola]